MRSSRVIAVLVSTVALVLAPSGLGPKPTASEAVVPAVQGQLRVTAAGDYSASSAASGVLNRVATIKPDFNIALGDLSYGVTGQEQAWCDFVTSRTGAGFPFQLLAGNHESNGQNGNINDFSACLPNQLPGVVGTYGRQYYVDVPEVNPIARFVMISAGLDFPDGWWDYRAGTARYNWTSAAIDGARAAGIPWVVASMHYPCLSMGDYPCAAGTDITNLLLNKKVDLVLNGHEHFYQRTKQLSTGPGCTSLSVGTYNSACVKDADNSLAKGVGTVFATVGTGGAPLRNVNTADSEAPYFAAYSALNVSPSYGLIDLQFTPTSINAKFVATSGSFADNFTIAADGTNAPPVAAFTNTCAALSCSFDGSGSTDSDGTITSYAWNFGDGTTASTAVAQKTYAAAGTYNVTLTVTDNGGSTAMAGKQVTVGSPSAVTASDDFERTQSGGWGSADVGGPWTTIGSSSAYSVSGGTGRIAIQTAGASNAAYLGNVSSSATDLSMVLAADKRPSGSSLYLTAIGRRIEGAGEYRTKLSLSSSGSVSIALERTSSTGAETIISNWVTVSGLTYSAGDKLAVRLQVTGTSPTTISAKVWKVGSPEPTAWQRSVTDTTAGLQAPGGIGVATYLSRSATNAPIVVSVDALRAAPPS